MLNSENIFMCIETTYDTFQKEPLKSMAGLNIKKKFHKPSRASYRNFY